MQTVCYHSALDSDKARGLHEPPADRGYAMGSSFNADDYCAGFTIQCADGSTVSLYETVDRQHILLSVTPATTPAELQVLARAFGGSALGAAAALEVCVRLTKGEFQALSNLEYRLKVDAPAPLPGAIIDANV